MNFPHGFNKKERPNKIYRLLKSLYRMKQASRRSLSTKRDNDNIVVFPTYVDDLLLIGNVQR